MRVMSVDGAGGGLTAVPPARAPHRGGRRKHDDEAQRRGRPASARNRLRLEVEDPGRDGPVTRREPDGDRGGGFGLNIVDTIAERWGVSRACGTLVWVELQSFPAAG
jgi:hypothetical protein